MSVLAPRGPLVAVAAPTVVVLAVPHLFASLIADALRERGTYEVVVPDLLVDDLPLGRRYDAAITSMPVSREIADVVIELPDTFERPLKITIGDVTVLETVHIERPIEGALAVLDRVLLEVGER